MQRRSFLAGILAAGSAPALCKAGFLMPVKAIQHLDNWPLLSAGGNGPLGFSAHADYIPDFDFQVQFEVKSLHGLDPGEYVTINDEFCVVERVSVSSDGHYLLEGVSRPRSAFAIPTARPALDRPKARPSGPALRLRAPAS